MSVYALSVSNEQAETARKVAGKIHGQMLETRALLSSAQKPFTGHERQACYERVDLALGHLEGLIAFLKGISVTTPGETGGKERRA